MWGRGEYRLLASKKENTRTHPNTHCPILVTCFPAPQHRKVRKLDHKSPRKGRFRKLQVHRRDQSLVLAPRRSQPLYHQIAPNSRRFNDQPIVTSCAAPKAPQEGGALPRGAQQAVSKQPEIFGNTNHSLLLFGFSQPTHYSNTRRLV